MKGEQSLLKPPWKETNESCRPKKQTIIHHCRAVVTLKPHNLTSYYSERMDRHDDTRASPTSTERMIVSLSSLWQADPYRPLPCRGQSDGLESVHWLEINRIAVWCWYFFYTLLQRTLVVCSWLIYFLNISCFTDSKNALIKFKHVAQMRGRDQVLKFDYICSFSCLKTHFIP